MINKELEKGVSLIITFFILTILLSIVLSISIILYSEIKIIRNIGNSVVAFYVADGAVEKVLYYDRHVIPTGAARGLCYMCDSSNANKCPTTNSVSSLNCLNCSTSPLSAGGCDPITCSNCKVTFNTTLVAGEKSYSVDATVFPNNLLTDFSFEAVGTCQNVKRAIKLSTSVPRVVTPPWQLRIESPWLSSRIVLGQTQLNFGVEIIGNAGVVLAYIQSPDGINLAEITMDSFDPLNPSYSYTGSWTGATMGTYYIDIMACNGNDCVTANNVFN